MARRYLPKREIDLLAYTERFGEIISRSPEQFGLTAQRAAEYCDAQRAFAEAYAAAQAPARRTPISIREKNEAKAELVRLTRGHAQVIQSNPATTDEMRVKLGLAIPAQRARHARPPECEPDITILGMGANTVRVLLGHPDHPNRRKKPEGAMGATLLYCIGDHVATCREEWSFLCNTKKTLTDAVFPRTIRPGTKVWLTAMWFNRRMENSPAAMPVCMYASGEMSLAA